jgi:hypothetical protein
VAYGDRDPSVHGGQVEGLPVLSPAEVATRHRADVILVASTLVVILCDCPQCPCCIWPLGTALAGKLFVFLDELAFLVAAFER